MRSLTSAFLLMTALSGCVVVGGRIRSAASPVWVEARSHAAASVGEMPRVAIHVFLQARDSPLPGVEVILTSVGHTEVRAITDPAGLAVVTLAPGSWTLR